MRLSELYWRIVLFWWSAGTHANSGRMHMTGVTHGSPSSCMICGIDKGAAHASLRLSACGRREQSEDQEARGHPGGHP